MPHPSSERNTTGDRTGPGGCSYAALARARVTDTVNGAAAWIDRTERLSPHITRRAAIFTVLNRTEVTPWRTVWTGTRISRGSPFSGRAPAYGPRPPRGAHRVASVRTCHIHRRFAHPVIPHKSPSASHPQYHHDPHRTLHSHSKNLYTITHAGTALVRLDATLVASHRASALCALTSQARLLRLSLPNDRVQCSVAGLGGACVVVLLRGLCSGLVDRPGQPRKGREALSLRAHRSA